ncbi:MAG: hypothetical protein WC688_07180 [Parachlamydiales bacterium]|jgi:hypothetical protein
MKKTALWAVICCMLLIFSAVVRAEAKIAGKIDPQDDKQIIQINLKNGKLRGIISKKSLSNKNVESIIFHSVMGEFSGEIVEKNHNWIKLEIPGTAARDGGFWEIIMKSGRGYFLNPDKFEITKPWYKKDGRIWYGNYQKPELRFNTPGILTINFQNNALPGFVSTIKKENVEYLVWNPVSDWGKNIYTGTIAVDNLGDYYCNFSPEVPNSGKGTVLAKMKDGSEVWLLTSDTVWDFGDNIAIIDDGSGALLEYIIAP